MKWVEIYLANGFKVVLDPEWVRVFTADDKLVKFVDVKKLSDVDKNNYNNVFNMLLRLIEGRSPADEVATVVSLSLVFLGISIPRSAIVLVLLRSGEDVG